MRKLKLNTSSIFVNFLLYNSVWLLCIFGQQQFIGITVILLVIHFVGLHKPTKEFALALIVASIGVLMDSLLVFAGVFVFDATTLAIPFWLIMLWLMFASSINYCFQPLTKLGWVLPLFAAFGGTASYITGANFGAVELGYSVTTTVVILACCWAALMPSLFFINHKLRAYEQTSV